MVFEYSSGVRSIADELLYRERQFPFEPKGFCQWGAKPRLPSSHLTTDCAIAWRRCSAFGCRSAAREGGSPEQLTAGLGAIARA